MGRRFYRVVESPRFLEGVVIYEVVEDELLVMLHDYLWERIDQPE